MAAKIILLSLFTDRVNENVLHINTNIYEKLNKDIFLFFFCY